MNLKLYMFHCWASFSATPKSGKEKILQNHKLHATQVGSYLKYSNVLLDLKF